MVAYIDFPEKAGHKSQILQNPDSKILFLLNPIHADPNKLIRDVKTNLKKLLILNPPSCNINNHPKCTRLQILPPENINPKTTQ